MAGLEGRQTIEEVRKDGRGCETAQKACPRVRAAARALQSIHNSDSAA